jgi:hypothetical protein
MQKRILSTGILLVCCLSVGAAGFVQSAEKLTIDQLTQAAKRYFRDTVEMPLLQKMTFTATDPKGKVRKSEHVTANYVFKGYNPQKQTASAQLHGEVSMWAAMRGAKMFKAAFNSGLWTMFAGELIYSDASIYSFEAGEPRAGDGMVIARLTHVQPCATVTMIKNANWYGPDKICGTSEFQLLQDLSLQKFSYEISGLPAPVKMEPFGQCMLRRYHAEVEFQKVMLPGDKEPFLVPKQVTATLETDKGTIVIFSVYEPKVSTPH